MLIFHRKSLIIYPDNRHPLWGSETLLSELNISDHGPQLKCVYKLFNASENKKISLDSHLFDVVGPILQDPKAFSVYLMIHRLSEFNIFIGSIEDLMKRMNLNRFEVLSALSLLEEYLLIKITGINLLKIEINANWF